MKPIVEVCTGSYQDCLAADRGGAERVELNCGLSVGGLTPGISVLRRVKAETGLKVIAMVRPRAGGFCYDADDVSVMMDDARLLMENGADGLAFGFLNSDGTFNATLMKEMADLIHSYHGEAVCHRAFDVSEDAFKAMETLIECDIDRVLTSGLEAKAIEGKAMLAELQQQFGDRIELLAGSGVNLDNAEALIKETGITQIHSSCKSYRTDPTTEMNHVSYAYLSGEHRCDYDVVDEEIVRKLVALAEASV